MTTKSVTESTFTVRRLNVAVPGVREEAARSQMQPGQGSQCVRAKVYARRLSPLGSSPEGEGAQGAAAGEAG